MAVCGVFCNFAGVMKLLFRHSLFIAGALLMVLAACAKHDAEPTLAVSVEPQRQLLEALVGDRYKVIAVLPRGANPETFEPSMAGRMALEHAQAYFTIGDLPFEQAVVSSLPEDVRIVNSTDGITPVYGTHSHDDADEDTDDEHDHGDCDEHHHHHGGADPHKWASVRNARVIARNMLSALVALDPEGAPIYKENHARLDSTLQAADATIAAKLGAAPRNFAIWHPSLSYFARDYGLNQIAVGFENKEVSPRQLAEKAEKAKDAGVKVLFFQREYDSRQAATLNKMMGTRLVDINPLDHDWLSQLNLAADELAKP